MDKLNKAVDLLTGGAVGKASPYIKKSEIREAIDLLESVLT